MGYSELVAKGRKLVRDLHKSKFNLGDLAAQVEVGLDKFAEDIGINPTSLARYRSVASAIPEDARDDTISFSLYEEALSGRTSEEAVAEIERLKAKFGDALTLDRARIEWGKRPTRSPRTGTREEQVDTVKQLLSNPDVADRVLGDMEVAAHVVQAQERVEAEQREHAERTSRSKTPNLHHSHTVITVASRLGNSAALVAQSLDDLRDEELSDQEREMLRNRAEKLEVAVGYLTEFLSSGNVEFEDQLAALLDGGS